MIYRFSNLLALSDKFTKTFLRSPSKQLTVINSLHKSFANSFHTKEKTSTNVVTVDQLNSIRIIGINRPEKRNCINNETAEALLQAFKDFDDDENSNVAVLHGVGGNFCAGYDLNEISSSTADLTSNLKSDRGPMGPTWYETSKPVIGAVEGFAVAGGMELALWCDVRVMEETAVMGFFCRRWGVPLIDGGTSRLPALVGLGRALDIIMTGRPVRAPEALQIGLVNHVVACGSAIGRAVFYAQSFEKYPAEALRADRNSARRAFSSPSLRDSLEGERRRGLSAFKEAKIGAATFVKGEGRHGTFKGSKEIKMEQREDAVEETKD